MGKLPLTQGFVAELDETDLLRAQEGPKWRAQVDRYSNGEVRTVYGVRHIRLADGRRTSQLLHRFITEAPSGLQVDHRDGNGLNNTRQNLRIVTHAQNTRNRRGVRGVRQDRSGRWSARIKHNGLERRLGTFDTYEEARSAYLKAKREVS